MDFNFTSCLNILLKQKYTYQRSVAAATSFQKITPK
jgi:hypothetical protein